jgi:hypothetical protein
MYINNSRTTTVNKPIDVRITFKDLVLALAEVK